MDDRTLEPVREGHGHWWMQRLTAVALIPLSLWMIGSLIALAGRDASAFVRWLVTPLSTVLMVVLLIALFHHTALGLQVVVEDYVHPEALRSRTVTVIRIACAALAAAGIIAVLAIAFAG